jgi:hypothetical protein
MGYRGRWAGGHEHVAAPVGNTFHERAANVTLSLWSGSDQQRVDLAAELELKIGAMEHAAQRERHEE